MHGNRGVLAGLGALLLAVAIAVFLQMRGPDVDQATVGTWALTMNGGRWLWMIRPDGGYEFHSEAADGAPAHAGKFSAHGGKWSLQATSGYADGGSYSLQPPDTMIATGRWGTANWQRIAEKRNDPGTVGSWALAVSGGRWVLKIDGAGGYDFHSEANDGTASHAGRFAASDGYWWLLATNGYADGGTYNLDTPDVFSATGHLGNGAWLRDEAWAKQTVRSAHDGDGQALRTLTVAADGGDREAQFALGEYYDTQKDEQQAAAWWQKAANQGQVEAEYDMGALYQNGTGVPQNSGEAVKWYTKAAAQGDAEAELQLGNAYSKGRGVEQSDSVAVSWWKKSAAQHNPDAESKLAFAYRDGKGAPKDLNRFFYWNTQSAQDLLTSSSDNAGTQGH